MKQFLWFAWRVCEQTKQTNKQTKRAIFSIFETFWRWSRSPKLSPLAQHRTWMKWSTALCMLELETYFFTAILESYWNHSFISYFALCTLSTETVPSYNTQHWKRCSLIPNHSSRHASHVVADGIVSHAITLHIVASQPFDHDGRGSSASVADSSHSFLSFLEVVG